MLLHDDDAVDDLDLELTLSEEHDERVPGIASLLLGIVDPRPYPINIYNFDNDKTSGIAGTLYPDGTFKPLPVPRPDRTTRIYDEVTNLFINGVPIIWDGQINGSLELNTDGPHRRLWDASLTGPWPIHPPRPAKPVNPERAREAAIENERDKKETETWK